MDLISQLFSNPFAFFTIVIALIISITIHEFAHAYVAYKLGDPTPKLQGRVTLNPLSHLDPLGSLLLVIFGFGWGRPVEFNPENLTYPKRDTGLIAVAGPVSNILLGTLLIILSRVLGVVVLAFVAYVNFFLAFFNLIPVYPLDGFNVVLGLLPYSLAYKWRELEQYSWIFLLIIVFTSLPGKIVTPLVQFTFNNIDNLVKYFL